MFPLFLISAPDLTPHILELLNEFVYQLVCSGQLMMAKLLRNNILEKVTITMILNVFAKFYIRKLSFSNR